MARLPRYAAPGIPQHVIQRGNDRSALFAADSDYEFFHGCLRAACERYECQVHAYVLMTNHVHLLVTPTDASGPSRMMQSLGRRYVRYFNDRYRRTGTLWEGRYRSVPIRTDAHLLACSRYIELNPVRATMVGSPGEYEWSSFRCNAGGREDEIVQPHPLYLALGAGAATRQKGYRALCKERLAPDVVAAIRAGTRGRFEPRATTYEEAVTTMNDRLFSPRDLAGGATSDVVIPWPPFPVASIATD